MDNELRFYCDEARHLICIPYTVDNLHEMARRLRIKRCWFHAKKSIPHYDIPKRRVEEIQKKCAGVLSSKDLIQMVLEDISSQNRKFLK